MPHARAFLAATALAHAVVVVPVLDAPSHAASTERVSLGAGGVQADGSSVQPDLSADGRFVAFLSAATNLIPGDTNQMEDVFVRDRRAGTTERVSVATGGAQARGEDGFSWEHAISADGRFVAFSSRAANLVPGDTNARQDVFVHDRLTRRTERVNVSGGGAQARGYSFSPGISADGRCVTFDSDAANLVLGDTSSEYDIFLRDRRARRTERISVGREGAQAVGSSGGSEISADGTVVAFTSEAGNLVAGDDNGGLDVFVRDRVAGVTRRANVSRSGAQADRPAATRSIALAAGGRFVAFVSAAKNLAPGGTRDLRWNIFLRDLRKAGNERINLSTAGATASSRFSNNPAVAAGGRVVAFDSDAGNLVPGDTNAADDVFVRLR